MKVGGKRKLLVPAVMGYGERGAGEDIPPDSDLLFEVEVLGLAVSRLSNLHIGGTGKVPASLLTQPWHQVRTLPHRRTSSIRLGPSRSLAVETPFLSQF